MIIKRLIIIITKVKLYYIDPPIDLAEKTLTVQSEAVVESDTDSDFELD